MQMLLMYNNQRSITEQTGNDTFREMWRSLPAGIGGSDPVSQTGPLDQLYALKMQQHSQTILKHEWSADYFYEIWDN